ncbi:tRNA pseudouridine(38-40) synthase TruA [Pseudodesulfovibrio sp.]|uniref:tRNA pseudouridine(38-40) synthase TruA n=1 Tax=unclassified Pseudodesulfovibrio TaxID=2661612 RepID=UPI003B001FC7
MPRVKLVIAYEGTDFSGWQLQARDRTVQGELEGALARLVGVPVRAHGSGRTDAGVHAMGQVVHFDCAEDRMGLPWRRALNALLPPDVRVLDAEPVSDDFHARYSAEYKTYEYVLWHEAGYCLPQRRRFVWNCGPVDFTAMEAAAALLVGEHDFSAFQNVGTPVKSTVRTIFDLSRHAASDPRESVWRFTANGFLKQMVRNIMGCLVACGRGFLPVLQVRQILDSGDRSKAPATAPPQGLSLVCLKYHHPS